jgi:hypothetical protein
MKVGRNDPCPCGSGKKYKKCCWGISGERSIEVPHDELKFERMSLTAPCPCRGGRSFGACHGAVDGPLPETPPPLEFVSILSKRQGTTPEWQKHLIEAAIRFIFTPVDSGVDLGQPRGESCATVAMQTLLLLKHYGVAARVIAGAARWKGYPSGYRWGGQDEYHMWVETEFGEIVDLTCDDLNSRTGVVHAWPHIPAPRNCWESPSALSDRGYVEIEGGHAQISVDVPGEPAFDRLAELALNFCRSHEDEFRRRYSEI